MDHPELPLRRTAENLGVSESALKNWMKAAKEHEGSVPPHGSGNYASDEAKELIENSVALVENGSVIVANVTEALKNTTELAGLAVGDMDLISQFELPKI